MEKFIIGTYVIVGGQFEGIVVEDNGGKSVHVQVMNMGCFEVRREEVKIRDKM